MLVQPQINKTWSFCEDICLSRHDLELPVWPKSAADENIILRKYASKPFAHMG